MSLQKIKLVTFDVTNTLLKFKVPAWQYYALIAQDHGFRGTEDEIKTKFKRSFKFMWDTHPNFGKKSIEWENWWCRVVAMTLKDHLPPTANIDSIAQKLIDEFRTDRCWRTAHGGDKLINYLKKLGIVVGVISNFDPRLNDILHNVSIHNNFDFVLTSYEIGYSKPDERIFRKAIDLSNISIEPSQALHIGDDISKDYEGARAAGWHALLVNSKIKKQAVPTQDHVFENLSELNSAIQQDKLKL